MKINETIRKYRKKENLTQEQIADYLGVTAPAVNKWEKGISYPDITLLAPLARILKINVDTLLSFKEELTDVEINQFVKEISEDISSNGYLKAFEKANLKIKEYPNCNKLILYVAQIMNGYLFMGTENIIDEERYQKKITSWFETVAFCEDKELANMAIISLAQNYSRRGQFEEAQKLLDKVPPAGFDKRIIQANLYSKQGKYNKAYEIHESMIYQYANGIMNNIMQIITLLCEEEKYQEALEYADLASKAAEYFTLGKYIGQSAKLTIYLKQQDEEKCLQILEKIMAGIDSIKDTKNSKLYSHLKFKEDSSIDEMKTMILKSLENDKEVDFLRDNPRFKAIFNF